MDNCQSSVRENKAAEKAWNDNVETMRQASPADSFNPQEYLAERAKEDEAFAEMLDHFAEMFFRELTKIGSRQDGIETLKKRFRHSGQWGGEVEYEGSGKGLMLKKRRKPKILRTWTEVYDLLCLDALYRVAQLQELDAAAENDEDEETAPAAGTDPEWHAGNPQHDGRYLCMVDMQTNRLHEQRCDWKDGTWYVYGNPIHEMFKVVYWYQLPSRTDFYLDTDEEADDE